jgi:hypothetical protein
MMLKAARKMQEVEKVTKLLLELRGQKGFCPSNGVITEIGARGAIEVPATAQRIDGTGLYLAPGLIDAYVHLRDQSELMSYLAHGVTTVVHLSGPTGNLPNVLDLRGRVVRGEIVAPPVQSAGRIVDGDRFTYTARRNPSTCPSI